MSDTDDGSELLFFDTFSHEEVNDINLDLVQFPKPVYITQVRIIPLGARVQADFPGGVRLGATNPSQFDIDFFVNDLGLPGASTFEILGHLRYNQNDCIHLECSQEKIPTDGLVLRGWYSTITLAVYGILTNSVNEPIASPTLPCEPSVSVPDQMCAAVLQAGEVHKDDWQEDMPAELLGGHKTSASDYEHEELEYGLTSREHFHPHPDEEQRELRRMRRTSRSTERSPPLHARAHSSSNEREREREREYMRARDKATREWSRSPEYSSRRSRRKRSERARSEAEDAHKWPRTPPVAIDSPARPRSPDAMDYDVEVATPYKSQKSRGYSRRSAESPVREDDETSGTPNEQFEPIMSDEEDILCADDIENAEDAAAAAALEKEIEAAAAAAPPAIEKFEPARRALLKYSGDLHTFYSKDLENLRILFHKFEMHTSCEKYATYGQMDAISTEEREQFVLLGEQLVNELAYLTMDYKRRNFVLTQFFKSDDQHLVTGANILRVALEYEAACVQPQPPFKIRHIKLGARLAELLGCHNDFFVYMMEVQNFDIIETIFKLYRTEYMALSIRLQFLRALYSTLDTKRGIKHFLSSKINGYQFLVENVKTTKLTRTKFAVQAILKKLHLYEALESVREHCTQLFVLTNYYEPNSRPLALFQHMEYALELLMEALDGNPLSYQQPRRFLPVSKKFEIAKDAAAQRSFNNSLQGYLHQHALAESLLILLSNAKELPATTFLSALDVLHGLLQTPVGLDYFVDDAFETTQLLVAVLLGTDDVPADTDSLDELEPIKKDETDSANTSGSSKKDSSLENISSSTKSTSTATTSPTTAKQREARKKYIKTRLHELGMQLAYKVMTRYHLDAIVFTAAASEYDEIKLATHLSSLYSQTCNPAGRQYTVEVFGMNNHVKIFMDLIKKEQRLQAQYEEANEGSKYKSPVLSYAIDMIDCCVRYCEQLEYLIEHGPQILELAKNHESYEPSVSAVLQEMYVYLKPLEGANAFDYDDITSLVESITRALDYITTFPGDLIMALRILRHLGMSKQPLPGVEPNTTKETVELKHRYVILKLFSADGVPLLLQVLEKLAEHFEQPGLHAPILATIQGLHCVQIILPSVQLLRETLSFAIRVRDGDFKDLTAIEPLMRCYFLLYYYPKQCQAKNDVDLAKQEIVQTLLAYSQPFEKDEGWLHRSLWTTMFREVLTGIDAPHTFIPGLQLLAELLPLPLPIPLPISDELQKQQKQRLITERKLWSAHLHPLSSQISYLVESLAPSSFPQLSELLQRVCMQIADLAPNMSLLIAKTIVDFLWEEWNSANFMGTAQLARLLNFSARLCAFAPLKSSLLSILPGRFWDLLQALLGLGEVTAPVCKCQVAVHRILESFLDSGISLVYYKSTAQPALNLASAVPPRELIPRITETILSNVLHMEVIHDVSENAVRNLVILTEHDFTFYHLVLHIRQRANEFNAWLYRVVEHNEIVSFHTSILSLVLLLRALSKIEPPPKYQAMPLRTLKLSPNELAQIMHPNAQNDAVEKSLQLLQRIIKILGVPKSSAKKAALTDLQLLVQMLTSCDATASVAPLVPEPAANVEEEASGSSSSNAAASSAEPTLPQAESIVSQYDARPIFTRFHASAEDAQLTSKYWLEPLPIEIMEDMDEPLYERVPCDLGELAKECLAPEASPTGECPRVLHLSESPQSTRERTPTAPCFRTRRVEVEPTTGRPEKKVYITAVRGRGGYSRPPPSRGDLFRSRPPNTSRPPSLHVDDFQALETCGAQPTGPTGYNKIPSMLRGARIGRNRGSRMASSAVYRAKKLLRTSSPSTWSDSPSTSHYRPPPSEPHFSGNEPHYSGHSAHFSGRSRPRGPRTRPYMR